MNEIHTLKLNKISQTPPLNRKVFIVNKDNNWGYGSFFKWTKDSCGEKADGKVYCDFWSPGQTWLGEPTSSFLYWAEIPVLQSESTLNKSK